jgi:GDPmannose 4,6-dehydratase
VREFLEVAFAAVGIERWEAHVEVDAALLRPADGVDLVGDTRKARDQLGWVPAVGFDELVRMMVASDVAEQARSTR